MIDSHCHLTFPQLYGRLDEVLSAASDAGVSEMITVGTTPEDAALAREIAETHPQVYFAAGVHPHYAVQVPIEQLPDVIEMARHPRCVALGEMGLDYHYDDPPPQIQQELFAAQLQAVAESGTNKPIILHCRRAVADTLARIGESGLPGDRFVFHCFTETPNEARAVLEIGAMISFTGIVTYKNADDVQAAARLVPDDRIMIETDAPYLSPEPHRKVRPNEPRYVAATARFLAELRNVTLEQFTEQTTANTRRFFALDQA